MKSSLIFYSVVTISFLQGCFLVTATAGEEKKPNIIVIFADDVGTGDVPGMWWKNGERDDMPDMPNIQSLLDEGTSFTDAHSTPRCTASRYTFLSGNYAHRSPKMRANPILNYGKGSFRPEHKTIAQALKGAGYVTSMLGKWHLGGVIPTKEGFVPHPGFQYPKSPGMEFQLSNPGHDWSKRLEQGPGDIGFDFTYFAPMSIHHPPYLFFYKDKLLEKDFNNFTYWPKGYYNATYGESKINAKGEGAWDWESSAFNMILVNKTEAFIDLHLRKNPDKPFFTYMALGAAHMPHTPPDKYIDGTPIAGQNENKHKDMLFELDKVVGSVVKMLEEREIMEETIIVFASDNGGLESAYSSGELRSKKGSIHEGGHRVPMTIRWDGKIPKGESRSKHVGLNDLFATLCDLVGVDVPAGSAIDSHSFADYALDGTMTEGLREYLHTWTYTGSTFVAQAIRKDELKLIHWYYNNTFNLYNLTDDISEAKDIKVGNLAVGIEMFRELKKVAPCYDNKGKFNVVTRWLDEPRVVGCTWFREDRARCDRFLEGVMNCRATCRLDDGYRCKTGPNQV